MKTLLVLRQLVWTSTCLFGGLFLFGSCSQHGFSREEKAIIEAPAPEGRPEYGGQLMRVWKITDHADSLLLRAEAAPFTEEMLQTEEYARLRERMLITVTDSLDEGVGIAAPQVGISRQVIAVQRCDKEGEPFEFFINPEIVEKSDSTRLGIEGCLSIPDIWGKVRRSQEITLRYRDEQFKEVTETIKGFTAVIFQHEVDHLNGILFIDRMEGEYRH